MALVVVAGDLAPVVTNTASIFSVPKAKVRQSDEAATTAARNKPLVGAHRF